MKKVIGEVVPNLARYNEYLCRSARHLPYGRYLTYGGSSINMRYTGCGFSLMCMASMNVLLLSFTHFLPHLFLVQPSAMHTNQNIAETDIDYLRYIYLNLDDLEKC